MLLRDYLRKAPIGQPKRVWLTRTKINQSDYTASFEAHTPPTEVEIVVHEAPTYMNYPTCASITTVKNGQLDKPFNNKTAVKHGNIHVCQSLEEAQAVYRDEMGKFIDTAQSRRQSYVQKFDDAIRKAERLIQKNA